VSQKRTYFITGYPGFIGKRLVARLAREQRDASFHLLVQPKLLDEARRLVAELPRPARFQVLQGEIADMHLSLSGAEYARLCDEVTHIFHLAAVFFLGVSRDLARRVNVEGTRNVLELARDCRALERMVHFSTAMVAGDRQGVVCEDELEAGQGFHNIYEETKFQAEKLVRRAMRELPITVVRPSIVVGDSKTGEIDRFDGPYYLAILLVTSPTAFALPLPGEGAAPLHIVPVDFVVAAALALGADPRAAGRTFHLVDPCPMSSRRLYESVARRVRRKLPRSSVSSRAAEALLKMPFVERLTRPQRAMVSYINQLIFYNCQGTMDLLDGPGVRCPPIASYLPTLVDFVRGYYRRRRHEQHRVEDPLDLPLREGPPGGE
jgi:thioester reductase-like protein